MNEFIQKVQRHENLTQAEIETVMHEIMSGSASKDQMSGFLLALRDKGPTVDEITGAAKIMRQFVIPVECERKKLLDTCGTGGDKQHTFNISTLTAIVVAGAGLAVAKHGNRSVSSNYGSACILEALGVNINMDEKYLGACLDDIGIAFLFAQKLHPAMKSVAPVRKELGVETIFNVLGPLTNPARATHQIMGVYSRDLVEPMAHVLKNLGIQKAIVVHGSDGLDEITTTGLTFISEYNGAEIISYDISPEELGIPLANPEDLKGGTLEQNIDIFKNVLSGVQGPQRDIVLLNAAYSLYIGEKVTDINAGLIKAKESIDSGKAYTKLEELVTFTNRIHKVNTREQEEKE